MLYSEGKSYALQKLYSRLPADVKGHSVRVAIYMQMLTEQVLESAPKLFPEAAGVAEGKTLLLIREIGLYHDIGKANVRPGLLHKPGALTAEEYEEIKKHTLYMQPLMEPLLETVPITDRAFYSAVMDTGRSHHERWDGTGYPEGLRGDDIPFLARLCSICDAYDTMTSRRMYSTPLSPSAAAFEILSCSGTQFDPALTPVFALCKESFIEISKANRPA